MRHLSFSIREMTDEGDVPAEKTHIARPEDVRRVFSDGARIYFTNAEGNREGKFANQARMTST